MPCTSFPRRTAAAAFTALAVAGLCAEPARALDVLENFTQTQVTGGLARPTAMAFAPDGRLFVNEQSGRVRVIENGLLLPTSFVDLTGRVNSTDERGLLGIAFDPNFGSNGFVYVYHTVNSVRTGSPVGTPITTFNRVSRFQANGNVALAGSEQILMELDPLNSFTNHNGGGLHFGPDGKLYISTGENAIPSNSQTLNNRLGKILRINPDGTIPEDNPFFGIATGDNRAIWALGLRNPYTFAFQPGTGRMHINDVGSFGANGREEINLGIAGANYGWPTVEGVANNPLFVDPIHAYARGAGTTLGFAIAGGTFYNPTTLLFPESYVDDYFFADHINSWINVRDAGTGVVTNFATNAGRPVDLRIGNDGGLYLLSRDTGGVFRIGFNAPAAVAGAPEPGAAALALVGGGGWLFIRNLRGGRTRAWKRRSARR